MATQGVFSCSFAHLLSLFLRSSTNPTTPLFPTTEDHWPGFYGNWLQIVEDRPTPSGATPFGFRRESRSCLWFVPIVWAGTLPVWIESNASSLLHICVGPSSASLCLFVHRPSACSNAMLPLNAFVGSNVSRHAMLCVTTTPQKVPYTMRRMISTIAAVSPALPPVPSPQLTTANSEEQHGPNNPLGGPSPLK